VPGEDGTYVMYTYGGDSNFDFTWQEGDYNYDGIVDSADYGVIDFEATPAP
jgi:hypothetical protein